MNPLLAGAPAPLDPAPQRSTSKPPEKTGAANLSRLSPCGVTLASLLIVNNVQIIQCERRFLSFSTSRFYRKSDPQGHEEKNRLHWPRSLQTRQAQMQSKRRRRSKILTMYTFVQEGGNA